MKCFFSLLLPAALIICFSANAEAHGPAAYRPAGGGSPASSPTPAPAPAPAPGPGATPGLPGGQTPGVGGRGQTGSGRPNTPGVPGGGGSGYGYGSSTPRFKSKSNKSERYEKGALTVNWQAKFLPRLERPGYGMVELTINDAVRGAGGDQAWNLSDRPTLILVSDATRKSDLSILGQLDEFPDFAAASEFFNLVRLDSRSIQNKDEAKRHKRGVQLHIYNANGKRVKTLKSGDLNPNRTVKHLTPVITKDYGRPGSQAIAQMEGLMARKAMMNTHLKLQESKLFDPRTNATSQDAADRITRIRRELRKLKADKETLLSRK